MTSIVDRRLPHSRVRTGTLALGVLAAVVASLAVNTAIALAVLSTNPGGVQTGLSAAHYAPLTVLGVLAGTAGWALVRRHANRPRAVLRVLVPLVVLVSFVPDLLLLVATSTTPINVIALLGMHLAVAAITVPVLGRILPLPVQLPAAAQAGR